MQNDPTPILSGSMVSGDSIMITGGRFTQTFNDNREFRVQNSGRKDPLDVLKDATASSAFHDSEVRFDPPKCHPRTRIAVLAKIMDWILAQENETRDGLIMWLTGAAGAGKSSIAQSTVENCMKESDALVLASFFFNRSDSTRNHAQPLVATLVYQIYRILPAVRLQITSIIDDDPLIFTKNLDYQFRTLVMTPLKELHKSGHLTKSPSRRLIVIDGLDECIDRTSQVLILNTISNAVRMFEIPVVFLIASRPEHDIRATFSSKAMVDIRTWIVLDDRYEPDEDIRIFLNDSFRRIREEHPFRRMIPTEWPSNEVIEALVTKSSGQFIYPATIIKFIDSSRHRPDHRLEIVLKLRAAEHETPFEQLDMLYRHILSCVEPDIIGKVLHLFGYMFTWPKIQTNETSIIKVDYLMPLEDGELSILLCDLGALVQENDATSISSVRIWHASLEDFFSEPRRSKQFYIDPEQTVTRIVARCLQILVLPLLREEFKDAFVSLFNTQGKDCNISKELAEEVANFSIKQNFCQSIAGRTFKFLIHESDVQFVATFLQLSQRVAGCGYENIHDSQTEIDEIFLSNMEHYSTYGVLTLILCLVAHSGSDPLVPLVSTIDLDLSPWYNSIGSVSFRQNESCRDVLSLATARRDMPDAYMQIFSDFIRDPTRSGCHCIGPEAYQRATLFCMLMLEHNKRHRTLDDSYTPARTSLQIGPEGLALNDRSCGLCKSICRTESGQWTTKCGDKWYWDIEQSHLLVGYIIHFFPLCGRSNALIQRCQRADSFLDAVKRVCPTRWELAHQKSQDYLKRNQLPLIPRMWVWVTNICGAGNESFEAEISDENIY